MMTGQGDKNFGYQYTFNMSNTTNTAMFNNMTGELNPNSLDYGHTDDLLHMKMSRIFEVYIQPVLIVTGTIGNILILLTVRQRNVRNWSICFYLGAYACGNILILVPMFGLQWISNMLEIKYITNLSDWSCKVGEFLMRVITYSGIWFIVAMLIDQYIMIWHPLRAGSMCTVFMAKFAIIMIIVGLVVVSIHAIWTFELFQNGCFISHTPNDLLAMIWPWASLSFYFIVPLLLICVLLVLVTCGVFSKSTWKKAPSNNQVPIDITFMTIMLSTLLVLFATPATVVDIIQISLPPSWLGNIKFRQQIRIADFVTDILVFLNPALSYVVCIAFSCTLRTELKQLLRTTLCKPVIRVYEMQVNSNSSATQIEYENCSETTPL